MEKPRVPPAAKGHFFIGNAISLTRDPLGFVTRCVREHGDVVRIRFGPVVFYLLNHPTDIEYVLRGNHRNFIKDRGTRLLAATLGQGLVTSEGDFWRRQRRLSQPAFQLDQIQKYGILMVDCTQRLLDEWRPGATRNVHADMMGLTLEIIARVLFSSSVAGKARRVAEALDVIMKFWAGPAGIFGWWQRLPTPGNFRYRRAQRQIDAIILDTIARRKAEAVWPEDLLTRLLNARDEDGSRMSDRQVRDELVTLFLAGHETTAVALTFCFYLLAGHPEVEARLVAELDEVLGGQPPTVADLPRLRYAGWVVQEAMRLYPPVPSIGREALTECEIGGYRIPKGAQIALSQWAVHRDPRWYDDPEAFRPERWDGDLARRLPRCAYFPFGDGPRICIGNHFAMTEAVLILAAIASRYRLTLAPGQKLSLLPSITLRPKGGIRMVVQERTRSKQRDDQPLMPLVVSSVAPAGVSSGDAARNTAPGRDGPAP
jgi:cytochrome P450